MILLIPLALSMVLMVTAWTYCLRGWLATMMTNPRRRRTVIMCITLAFILIAQGPNLYFNVFQHHNYTGGQTVTREGRQRQNEERVASTEKMFDQFNRRARIHPAAVGAGGRAGAGRRKSAARAARHARLHRHRRRWVCGGRIAARCGFITAKPAARRR